MGTNTVSLKLVSVKTLGGRRINFASVRVVEGNFPLCL